MKKTIITVIAALFGLVSFEANAQLVYTPYIPNRSSSSVPIPNYSRGRSQSYSQPAPRVEYTRTNAYCMTGADTYGKMPIVIEYGSNGMRVVQVYYAPQSMVYGASEGRWVDIYPVSVTSCHPDYSNNPLEKSFMYKATINGTTFYFDL